MFKFLNYSGRVTFGLLGIVIGVAVSAGMQYVLAWTAPTGAPPSNNTPTPINVSATNQTKAGSLTLPSITDYNNGVYYVDPNATSRLNYGVYDNLYSYGTSYLPFIYDTNDSAYYLDPNSVSRLNDIRPNIMYDGQNTGYYVDPNGTSVLSTVYNYGPIYSTVRNYSITDDWALTTYTAGWGNNAEPQNARASIYTNDVYLRSIGKWASQLNTPNCRLESCGVFPTSGECVVTGMTSSACSESGPCYVPLYSRVVCN